MEVEGYVSSNESSPAGTYKSVRQSLRPLPQLPTAPSQTQRDPQGYIRAGSIDSDRRPQLNGGTYTAVSLEHMRPTSLARVDSVTLTSTSRSHHAHSHSYSYSHAPMVMTAPELQNLQKSSTSHLRTLSRLTQDDSGGDFSITSPAQEVTGLHGRRRLQRTGSTRASNGTVGMSNSRGGWSGGNWMDKQRQFLQAYEYLCHIGEAKEWIEDVIHKPIPPIVQLEEALRDGVTLAEIVQALNPGRPSRIFKHPRLQFRHSDNIALFFRFLAEMELPELFRFELIDLYEKKNIPKVIYCIHALSWLLYRKGVVDFRIGNLVGQLEFEHHELEEMQKGLDKAGVSMPSFSGMSANFGAEPEPEPLESEEDRIERELAENEEIILDLQAQIRGAVVRIRLGNTMQALWDSEDWLVDLQARIRGEWARQIFEYRIGMQRFTVNLQSAVRGFLVRRREQKREDWWKGRESDVMVLQSLVRANRARAEVQMIKTKLRREQHGVKELQASIRGALLRSRLVEQVEASRDVEGTVEGLQAAIRGALVRARLHADRQVLQHEGSMIAKLQAAVRGALLRQHVKSERAELQSIPGLWRALQALVRGALKRDELKSLRGQLKRYEDQSVKLQAAARGGLVRKEVEATKKDLAIHDENVRMLQAKIRGLLFRRNLASDLSMLKAQEAMISKLQAFARGCLLRRDNRSFLSELKLHTPEITRLQALSRAMLLRTEVGVLLARLEEHEEAILQLQAAIRGQLVRAKFAEKKRFFKENMEKVVKLQSFVRGRLQGEAYKSLTSGKNPPVGTIKGFVHLLNDSDFDFDEEIGTFQTPSAYWNCEYTDNIIEFERLRKTVVQHVRQNELAEQYIDQLDIKIALLVKNKITLDEVVKHQKHFGGHVGSLLNNAEISSKDPFDLKALNKNSRKKLEHYQQLFFVLQTQPQYLARLFKRIREHATAEKDCKRIETLMMGLFGYAQKRREEYYLLKLIARSIKEEVDGCATVQDYLRGNFFWAKLLQGYIRSPRDRKFMRDLLGPLLRENIVENQDLDLESDPLQIYQSIINNEELRTGQRSRRPLDIKREEAIRDRETRETFVHHLQDLRDIVDQFLGALEDLLPKMPYGIRFIAQQSLQALVARFPHENQHHLLQIVGHWVWKSYLQPALTQPEAWGLVEKGLAPLQKRNLGEVGKLIQQVAVGRLFGGESLFLQPLNNYVTEAIERAGEIWRNLISVRDAEAQFDIDEFNDLYARQKPTLYIKMTDIFAIHQLVAGEITHLCPSKDDMLRELVHELGSAKNNEVEMSGVSTAEISLTLNPKLHDIEDPDADIKALFMETKRCILYIIRIQSGANLMEILVKPITIEDEDKWHSLLREEFSGGRKRGAYSDAYTLADITSMSYSELKRTALENIVALEQAGGITRHNHYQDLLNDIAVDIRTKHRRRIQRQKELEGVKATLGNLNEKSVWLEQQLKSYNDYIEQAMVTLQNKKGKKRFLVPFTKQYNHVRELQRSGRVPKFGSFKYSARALADKGVLVSYKGYTERQYDKINLTISSDEVGVFFIEGSMGSIQIPGASAQVPLDDLLQAQFCNQKFMNLFEGLLRLNVNLFLHLLFRKFYRDE
ncbi:hypothetical protein FGG08_002152 [Glutinoglossum americanum]|uniref:Ras GTPase-activating-like protein IQGAP1 n=1 Tax=Glutinoglossum americanum TaxID=1670608 RepID=A0A9P8IDH7_9PEZI|nr:hypothetical protein FGG08_002152 [Glutinoglossum americanum]